LFDVSDWHQQTTPGNDIPSAHCQTATQSVARQLFSAMGIERDNKAKRQDWVLRGFRQFDAPVCVIITYDRVLDGSDATSFDCGAWRPPWSMPPSPAGWAPLPRPLCRSSPCAIHPDISVQHR
jgi:hypothetical protein